MDESLRQAAAMYPGAKYLYRTSDTSIHTTREGAEAQASHLSDAAIETIKIPIAASRPKVAPKTT